MNPTTPHGRQGGFLLLEGLVAILIFSLGILAMVRLEAVSIQQLSDAKYRVDASYLANQIISQMWIDDNTTLATNYNSPSGAKYATWLAQVKSALPGANLAANSPTIAVDANNIATVTVRWQLTPGSAQHSFVATAQIKK